MKNSQLEFRPEHPLVKQMAAAFGISITSVLNELTMPQNVLELTEAKLAKLESGYGKVAKRATEAKRSTKYQPGTKVLSFRGSAFFLELLSLTTEGYGLTATKVIEEVFRLGMRSWASNHLRQTRRNVSQLRKLAEKLISEESAAKTFK